MEKDSYKDETEKDFDFDESYSQIRAQNDDFNAFDSDFLYSDDEIVFNSFSKKDFENSINETLYEHFKCIVLLIEKENYQMIYEHLKESTNFITNLKLKNFDFNELETPIILDFIYFTYLNNKNNETTKLITTFFDFFTQFLENNEIDQNFLFDSFSHQIFSLIGEENDEIYKSIMKLLTKCIDNENSLFYNMITNDNDLLVSIITKESDFLYLKLKLLKLLVKYCCSNEILLEFIQYYVNEGLNRIQIISDNDYLQYLDCFWILIYSQQNKCFDLSQTITFEIKDKIVHFFDADFHQKHIQIYQDSEFLLPLVKCLLIILDFDSIDFSFDFQIFFKIFIHNKEIQINEQIQILVMYCLSEFIHKSNGEVIQNLINIDGFIDYISFLLEKELSIQYKGAFATFLCSFLLYFHHSTENNINDLLPPIFEMFSNIFDANDTNLNKLILHTSLTTIQNLINKSRDIVISNTIIDIVQKAKESEENIYEEFINQIEAILQL